jgi:glycosyltransferase involved in cell wall biosynthesis
MASGDPRERTSLIVTVLDEAATIDDLLASVRLQSLAPDEVVVVDGGSTDGTWERLQDWAERMPLRLVRAPGATIARGRNLAVEAATGEVIAVTDAGVRLDPAWLAELVGQLTPNVDVVSGFFRPDARTTFERSMGATVLPDIGDVDPQNFLPSSRSILFRRSAWERADSYPEWLDYCEDLVFDLALKQAGCTFAFAPRAIAWFRPRGSLGAFFRQYYLYARGDGKADLWLRRHLIRYATYAMGAALFTRGRWAWLPLAVGLVFYTRRPYQRLSPHLGGVPRHEAAYALALVPVIRFTGDVAKMLGYPLGVWWRLRSRWISRSSS